MKRPLEDVLLEHPELAEARNRREAEEHLEALFIEAQGKANAYASERLQEVFEVAERALALGSSFPPPTIEESRPRTAWFFKIPGFLGQYGAALLLAATAPLVANDSVILAVACGVGALFSLMAGRTGAEGRQAPQPKAVPAKFEGLISAADRTIDAMTAPRALEAPRTESLALAEDDMLTFLQDAVMAEGSEEAEELARNAERLIERAGYRVIRKGEADLFEIMVDPDVGAPLLLKPALLHRRDRTKSLFGVMVKGKSQ